MPQKRRFPLCGQLPFGEHIISAPVYDDAIQMGLLKPQKMIRLAVTVLPGEIDIRREDGQKFSIDDARQGDTWEVNRVPVLRSAVAHIALQHNIETDSWGIAADPELNVDPEQVTIFDGFVQTVTAFVLDRYNR